MEDNFSPTVHDSIVSKSGHTIPLLIDAASIAMYLLACALPAIILQSEKIPGFAALAFGWMALIVGQFAWCANPLLAIGWILIYMRRWSWAIIAGALAFAIGLDTFIVRVLPSDAPGGTPVVGFGVGAYVWLGSMAVVVIGAAIAGYGKRFPTANPSA